MSNIKINNEIELTYPDSYKEMTEEELTRYFGSPADRVGAFDSDRHIILSVSWQKAGFKMFMYDADLFLSRMEARLRKSLVNYQRVTSYKMKIGSKKAEAVRFEYRVNDSVSIHVADLLVFKYKKKFYAIYFVTRKKNAGDLRLELKEILNSVSLK